MNTNTEVVKSIIENVILVYSNPQVARENYSHNGVLPTPLSDNPLENKHYAVTVLLDTVNYQCLIAHEHKEKSTGNFEKVKKYSPEEAKVKYQLPREPEGEMFAVSFRQKAMLGKQGHRYTAAPIAVFGSQQIEDSEGIKYFDDKDQVINNETSIGNGSIGHLQYHKVKLSTGYYLYPLAVCIKDLIPYVGNAKVEPDSSAFGIKTKVKQPLAEKTATVNSNLFSSSKPTSNPWV